MEREIVSCRYFLAKPKLTGNLTPEENATLATALNILPQQDQLRLATLAQVVHELQEEGPGRGVRQQLL